MGAIGYFSSTSLLIDQLELRLLIDGAPSEGPLGVHGERVAPVEHELRTSFVLVRIASYAMMIQLEKMKKQNRKENGEHKRESEVGVSIQLVRDEL